MPHPSPTEPSRPVPAGPAQSKPSLRRRIYLTYRYLGWRQVIWRALTFPLRFTPLRRRLRLGAGAEVELARAEGWYRAHGRPVDIVIPTYGDTFHAQAAIEAIRKTVPRGAVRVIVCDDASPEPARAAIAALAAQDVEVVLGEENVGFAANANRGLAATDPERDVVLLNSDVRPHGGWLAALQHAAHTGERVGIVGGKLLYPDGRIQFAGSHRNLGAPEWFDHRYRFKPADYGPANVSVPVLAVTGACMYVRRELIDEISLLDDGYSMAYEDVDWCLRAWQSGYRVVYAPAATLTHLESVTRGTDVGERERLSQERFWARWGGLFDGRSVRTPESKLRVIYVTEDTGVGGGHRDIFEHLNRLAARGHDVRLFSLGPRPEWFDLQVPVSTFSEYQELRDALAPLDAIKVATWWNTSVPVWEASVLRGIPVFFVQDFETSYYPDSPRAQAAVVASYREEFRYMTISSWNRDQLRALGLDAELVAPGIDPDVFAPRDSAERRDDVVLALGRSHPLKNLPLTIDAWRALPEPRPQLWMFGIEPELGEQVGGEQAGVRYIESPTDEGVSELFNQCTVFVQTSVHEGFCLPPLEAMATGAAVVCTDAHGNRDFCRDGENCLMPAADVESVSGALSRVLGDPELRERLGQAGIETAREYAWERRIDTLLALLESVAGSPAEPAASAAVEGAAGERE
jgi:GT2 family glycosyltransferase